MRCGRRARGANVDAAGGAGRNWFRSCVKTSSVTSALRSKTIAMLGASRSALRFGLRSLATKARINAPPLVVITGEEYTNYASEL